MESAELHAAARSAYERGRVRWALQIGWVVAVFTSISILGVGGRFVSAAVGLALFAMAAGLRWRGGMVGRAVAPGLLAGLIPFGLLATIKCSGMFCCPLGSCTVHCTVYCAIGGLAAGALLALRARELDRDDVVPFLLAASLVAALTGLLGCMVGGATGIVWMLLAELAVTAPVCVLQLRR